MTTPGPLLFTPETPGVTATFHDKDERITLTLEATLTTSELALTMTGKRGGRKASLWLSPEDARALATFILAGGEAR